MSYVLSTPNDFKKFEVLSHLRAKFVVCYHSGNIYEATHTNICIYVRMYVYYNQGVRIILDERCRI